MQSIATRVFIYASLAFGVTGIGVVLTTPRNGVDSQGSDFHVLLMRLLLICVFIILPSFALSVAGKYLNGHSK